MPRPAHRDLDDDQTALIDHLTHLIRAGRARDAAYAADRALSTVAIREAAAGIEGHGLSNLAVVDHLAALGVRVSEGLLRKWALQADRPVTAPVWHEVIDHRPADDLREILERTLGMEVDVEAAPTVEVPLTPEQVEALRQALPQAVIGPVAGISDTRAGAAPAPPSRGLTRGVSCRRPRR